MEREVINVGAPPVAPYSHAVKIGNLVFTAGQIGQDPTTGRLVPGGIRSETTRALENLAAVLKAAGSSLDQVAQCTVYIVDMARDYTDMNEVYREFFTKDPPARATVQVGQLALGARVEISAIGIA